VGAQPRIYGKAWESDLLGERIRAERVRRGLSQAQLAQMAGLSAGALSQTESGIKRPSINSLRRNTRPSTFPSSGSWATMTIRRGWWSVLTGENDDLSQR
jgi:DNA-binding XRE family transcriptional regulator